MNEIDLEYATFQGNDIVDNGLFWYYFIDLLACFLRTDFSN